MIRKSYTNENKRRQLSKSLAAIKLTKKLSKTIGIIGVASIIADFMKRKI